MRLAAPARMLFQVGMKVSFSVSRSTIIDVTPETAFSLVRDFRRWPEWSPWLITDPDCKVVFDDDGRKYDWEGDIAGKGSIAIREEADSSAISYDLTFEKPFRSYADVQFSFAAAADGTQTEVTWAMKSSLPFFLFWMKRAMVAYCGADFERGLLMLKDLLENGAVPSKLEFLGTGSFDGGNHVAVDRVGTISGLIESMETDFAKLEAWRAGAGVDLSATPFTIYHKWDLVKGTGSVSCCYPVAEVPAELPEGLTSGSRSGGAAYIIRHTGDYKHLANAWTAGFAHMRAKKFALNKAIHPFEHYENNPSEVASEACVTTLYFPAK